MKNMMDTVKFYDIHDVRFEQAEKPVPKRDEALIRVAYAGICGSDMHIYNKGMFVEDPPKIMGHEFVGIIEEVGADLTGFEPGDIVVGNPMVTCGECEGCLKGLPNTCSNLAFIGEVCPGCFAEYIALKGEKLIMFSSGGTGSKPVDLQQAALTEPLAVALNVCHKAAVGADDDLLIIGAGTIGLLTLLAAKRIFGVKHVTVVGRSAFRMDMAKKMGADHVTDTVENGRTYDKVIETAGKAVTLNAAMEHTKPEGDIYVVSVFEEMTELDFNIAVGKQLNIHGCNAYEERHLKEAADILSNKRLDVSEAITSVVPLADCGKAFEALNEKDKKQVKILFEI